MAVTGLEHVLLLSDEIDATRDFYCRTLGLVEGARPALAFPGYWLYAGGVPCVHIADRTSYLEHAGSLGLPARPDVPVLVDHLAFTAPDYAQALERLERDGIEAIRNAVPAAGLRQLFFDGPDGVRLEVNVFEAAAATAAR